MAFIEDEFVETPPRSYGRKINRCSDRTESIEEGEIVETPSGSSDWGMINRCSDRTESIEEGEIVETPPGSDLGMINRCSDRTDSIEEGEIVEYESRMDIVEDDHIGWHFCPSDRNFIEILRAKILGHPLRCCDFIVIQDLYADFPWEVIKNTKPILDNQHVIVTPRKKCGSKGYHRYLNGRKGFWQIDGTPKHLTDSRNRIFGTKRGLSFNVGNRSKTWKLIEYEALDLENPLNLAICVLYEVSLKEACSGLERTKAEFDEALRVEKEAEYNMKKLKSRLESVELRRQKAAAVESRKRAEIVMKKNGLVLEKVKASLREQQQGEASFYAQKRVEARRVMNAAAAAAASGGVRFNEPRRLCNEVAQQEQDEE